MNDYHDFHANIAKGHNPLASHLHPDNSMGCDIPDRHGPGRKLPS